MSSFYNQSIKCFKDTLSCRILNFIKSACIISVVLLLFTISAQGECLDFEGGDIGDGWIDCDSETQITEKIPGWNPTQNESFSGNWSLESEAGNNIDTIKLCRCVERPKNFQKPFYVNFSLKLSDGMFYIKDDKKAFNQDYQRSGAQDWEKISYIIDDDKAHKITFKFVKTGANKSQYCWIDKIQIGPFEEFIELLSPDDNASYPIDYLVSFNYTPKDNKILQNCSLLIDGEEVGQKNESLVSGVNYTLRDNIPDYGPHTWSIRCCDNGSRCETSPERKISIFDPIPTVELISPPDRSNSSKGDLELIYKPVDNNLKNCSLYVDGIPICKNETELSSGTENHFEWPFEPGNYNWSVKCWDDLEQSNNMSSSEKRSITILKNERPTVDLKSPIDGDNASYINQNVSFKYIPKDDKELECCTLSIDGNKTKMMNVRPENGTLYTFNWTFDKCGYHNWTIICLDDENESNYGPIYNIYIKPDEHPKIENAYPRGGDTQFVNQTIEFEYTPSDDCRIDRCMLYIDEFERDCNESPQVGSADCLRAEISQPGNHTWKITCWDNSGNSNFSEGRISIIRPSSACVYQPGSSQCEPEGYDVRYTNISDAIRDIKEEGFVTVKFGNYTGNLIINRPLTLLGCDKCNSDAMPTIYGMEIPISVDSDNVTISGFIITGDKVLFDIKINDDVRNIILVNNTVLNGEEGICLQGRTAHSLKNISISGNTIKANSCGINLTNCTIGTVFGNDICCQITSSCCIARKNCNITIPGEDVICGNNKCDTPAMGYARCGRYIYNRR